MMMEKVEAALVQELRLSSTSPLTSSTLLQQLTQAVLGTLPVQETQRRPRWLLQPLGPPCAHQVPTAGPWALRYYQQMTRFMCVCLDGWMDRQMEP